MVNAYAEVTSISGRTLSLGTIDETGDILEDGEWVIVMQMQDDVIGSSTSNNSSFGTLSDIRSAGLYEIRQVESHTESGGTPTQITTAKDLSNTYNTGANSRVQVISFPSFGSPNYTTTSNMSAMDKSIRVLNFLSQDVTSRVMVTKVSDDRVIMDLSALASGVYYLKTRSAVAKVSKR